MNEANPTQKPTMPTNRSWTRSRTDRTEFEQQVWSTYLREFGIAMAAYAIALVTVLSLVDFETAGSWKYGAALIPVMPVLLSVRAIARSIARGDELEKDRQYQSMAIGFAVAMVASVTFGFLAMAGMDLDGGEPWLVFASGMASWGFARIRTSIADNADQAA